MIPASLNVMMIGGLRDPYGSFVLYTMDNIVGSTLNAEYSNYNASIYGANSIAGVIGNALNFDGTNDYVAVPNFPSTSAWSISVIIKPDVIPPALGSYILDKEAPRQILAVKVGTGQKLAFYDGTWHDSGVTLSTSIPSRVVFVNTGARIKIYVNGTQVHDSALNAYIDWSSGTVSMGKHATELNSYFDGYIDEFRYFNYALSPSEISTLP